MLENNAVRTTVQRITKLSKRRRNMLRFEGGDVVPVEPGATAMRPNGSALRAAVEHGLLSDRFSAVRVSGGTVGLKKNTRKFAQIFQAGGEETANLR